MTTWQKIRTTILVIWGVLIARFIATLRKKVILSREIEDKIPTPKFMKNSLTGYYRGWLPTVIKEYHNLYHFRMRLFEVVSKEVGKEVDMFQVTTPFFRTTPAIVSRDPVITKHILKNEFDSFVKPQYMRKILKDFLGDGIFVVNHGSTSSEDPTWTFQRKTAAKIFTKKIFTGHVYQTLMKNVDKIHNLLEKQALRRETEETSMDMKKLSYAFTLDSIGDIGFGVDLNTLNEEEVVPFSRAFDDVVQLTSRRSLQPFWNYLGPLLETERKLKQDIKTLDKFSDEIISARRIDPELQNKGDILSLFIQSDQTLSDKFLRDVVMSFMIAGRDTTACTMSFMFFILATHQDIQDKVYAEIDSYFSSKDERVSLEMLSSFPYLGGLVLETLRLFPPVPVDVKEAGRDNLLPNGVLLRKGTTISYDTFVMGHNEKNYRDAGSVKPERWIDSDGHLKQYDEFEFPVFQAGQRFCLGKHLAVYEIKVMFIEILKRFKFSLPKDKSLQGKELEQYKKDVSFLRGEAIYQPGITLTFKGEVNLIVDYR